jgi:Tol biopolymer transport system component
MDIDETNLQNLTNSPFIESSPAWSPDGRRIAYTSKDLNKSVASDVFIIDEDGKNVFNLTDDPAYNLNALTGEPANDGDPAWSPDGTQLAIYSDRDGYTNIWVLKSDGTDAVNITRNRSDEEVDYTPTWSPDGGKIAFISISGGVSDLMVVNVDGTSLDFLTFDASKDYDPAWSPDGTKIVFAKSDDGEKRSIWVINQDGTGATQLTNNPDEDCFGPSWSPDGMQIAFSAGFIKDLVTRVDIRVMDADGTNQISLTQESQSLSPTWSSSTATLIESTSWGVIKALMKHPVP